MDERRRYRFAKYMRISNEIALRLQIGNASADAPFLSRDELAMQYGISPTTATNVLRELAKRGVLQMKRGRRSVVRLRGGTAARTSALSGKRIALLAPPEFQESRVGDALLFFLRGKLAAAGAEETENPCECDAAVQFPFSGVSPVPDGSRPRVFCGLRPPRMNSISIIPHKAAALAAIHLASRRVEKILDCVSARHVGALPRRRSGAPIGFDFGKFLLGKCRCVPCPIAPGKPFLPQVSDLLRRELSDRSRAVLLIDDPDETIALSDFLRENRWPFPTCSILGVTLVDSPCVFPTVNLALDSLADLVVTSLACRLLRQSAPPALHVPEFIIPNPEPF